MAMLGAGCETLNYSQYQILGAVNDFGIRATVSASDRDTVKQIVSAAAAQFKLVDMTTSSIVPNTVAYYTQIDTPRPLEIKVYTSGDRLVVDVLQLSSGGESLAFTRLKETIVRDLSVQFGPRMVVKPTSGVPEANPKRVTAPAQRP
jgi:hypothetical protein